MAIEAAKPRDKPYKISDGNGLYLLVETGGSKLWRLRYFFDRKEKMLSLGAFPGVKLADARKKRDDARELLAQGIDPSNQRREDKIAAATAAANTFGLLVEEHLAKLKEGGAAESTLSKNKWLLQDLASPLTRRPLTAITSAEILGLLQKIEKTGRKETARRLRGAIGTMFRRAVATLRAPTDPTYALRDALEAPTVRHRPAITDEAQFGALLSLIDEYDGWSTLKAAMLFQNLRMVRPGEVRFMRRSEVTWPTATWKIPAKRMKMREPHDVPLSRQAQAILRSVWDLTEGDGLVFPSIRAADHPLSENAFNSVLRRLG
jgi:integrase